MASINDEILKSKLRKMAEIQGKSSGFLSKKVIVLKLESNLMMAIITFDINLIPCKTVTMNDRS